MPLTPSEKAVLVHFANPNYPRRRRTAEGIASDMPEGTTAASVVEALSGAKHAPYIKLITREDKPDLYEFNPMAFMIATAPESAN